MSRSDRALASRGTLSGKFWRWVLGGRITRPRALLRTWLRRLVIIFLLLILSPLYLVPAYTIVAPQFTNLMLWRAAQGHGISRQWVSIDNISPNLINAVLSSEDGRFCLHNGVDWQEMEVVIDDLIDGGEPRGASTLTMQLMKNLFLWPSRSYIRKGLEVPLAMYGDLVWSKRRTAEIYLNVVEWGPGIYGAEAASRRYFGKTSARLSVKEASLLATALPNPLHRNPRNPSEGHQRLASTVEARARKSGGLFSCTERT